MNGGASTMRTVGWCSGSDVVSAFRLVGQEIRTKFQRTDSKALTQVEACKLALRVRDQRELIRCLAGSDDLLHVRRLLRLNRKLRQRLVALAERAGLTTNILVLK